MVSEKQIVEFEIGDIWPITLTFVIAGLGIAYGLQAMGEASDSMGSDACSGYWNTTSGQCEVSSTNATVLSSNPAEYNATTTAIEGVAKFPEKFGTIITIVVAAIIIMILVRYLGARA